MILPFILFCIPSKAATPSMMFSLPPFSNIQSMLCTFLVVRTDVGLPFIGLAYLFLNFHGYTQEIRNVISHHQNESQVA